MCPPSKSNGASSNRPNSHSTTSTRSTQVGQRSVPGLGLDGRPPMEKRAKHAAKPAEHGSGSKKRGLVGRLLRFVFFRLLPVAA
jgi:hypothetical protein